MENTWLVAYSIVDKFIQKTLLNPVKIFEIIEQ